MYQQPQSQPPPPPSIGNRQPTTGVQFFRNQHNENAEAVNTSQQQYPPPSAHYPPPTYTGLSTLRVPPPLSIPQNPSPYAGSGAGGGGSTPLSIQISSSSSSPVTPHRPNTMSPVYPTYRGIAPLHGQYQVPLSAPSYPPIQPASSQPSIQGYNSAAQNAIKQTPNYFPNILPPPPTSHSQDQLSSDPASSTFLGLGIASRSLSQEQGGRSSSFDSSASTAGVRPAGPSSSSSSARRNNQSSSSVRIEPSQMPRPVFTNMYAHLYQQPTTDESEQSADSPDKDKDKESTITISNFHTRSATSRRNPPPCNSPFVSIDTGNCTPRHMRATLVAPPSSKEVGISQIGIPFAVIATPFAVVEAKEDPVCGVLFDDSRSPQPAAAASTNKKKGGANSNSNSNDQVRVQNPPRCSRCQGYINPSVQWTDKGQKWICNLCQMSNQVPEWYFCGLDAAGLRQDRLTRPELQLGSVDFVVNEDYCSRPPQKPTFVFAVDVSARALSNGMTTASLRAVRSAIETLRTLSTMSTRSYQSPASAGHKRTGSWSAPGHGLGLGHNVYEQPSPMRSTINTLEPLFSAPSVFANTAQQEEENEVRVAIVTFSRRIHFYSANLSSAQLPVQVDVVDPDDPFCPLPRSRWLYGVESQMSQLEAILTNLPQIIATAANSELEIQSRADQNGFYSLEEPLSCPAAVVRAIQLGLSDLGGRIYLLTASQSNCGYGAVRCERENLNSYSTQQEFNAYCNADALTADATTFADPLSGFFGAGNPDPISVPGSSPSQHGGKEKQSQDEKIKLGREVGELYNSFSLDCCNEHVCVNAIVCIEQPQMQPEFVDTALLGQVCLVTGGRLVLFSGPLLQEENSARLGQQLKGEILRIAGNEAVIKVRTGLGYRAEPIIGSGRHSIISGETELCGVNEDSTFTVFLRQDSPLKDEDKVHIQLAVLYTTAFTRKRIVRVHNLTLMSGSRASTIFRNVDLEACASAIMRQALVRALARPLYLPSVTATSSVSSALSSLSLSSLSLLPGSSTSSADKEKERERERRRKEKEKEKDRSVDKDSLYCRPFINGCVVEALLQYRVQCSAQSPKGQLILPEALKVLPVYALGMLKHPALIENRPPVLPPPWQSGPPSSYPSPSPSPAETPRSASYSNFSPSISPRAGLGLSGLPVTHYLSRIVVRGHERAFELQRMLTCPVQELVNSLYPRLFTLLPMFLEDTHLDLVDEDEYGNSVTGGEDFSDCDSPQGKGPSPSGAFPTFSPMSQRLDGHPPGSSVFTFPPSSFVNGSSSGSDPSPTRSNSYSRSMEDRIMPLCITARPLRKRELLRLLSTITPSAEVFESDQVYLLDDRTYLWMLVGRSVSQEIRDQLFHPDLLKTDTSSVRYDTRVGRRINAFLNLLRSSSPYKQELKVLWADQTGNNALLNKFSLRLIEDSIFGTMSYVDYLCNMHSAIQEKMKG